MSNSFPLHDLLSMTHYRPISMGNVTDGEGSLATRIMQREQNCDFFCSKICARTVVLHFTYPANTQTTIAEVCPQRSIYNAI